MLPAAGAPRETKTFHHCFDGPECGRLHPFRQFASGSLKKSRYFLKDPPMVCVLPYEWTVCHDGNKEKHDMKNFIQKNQLFTALAVVLLMSALSSTQAQTYTWADNAQGQVYLACPDCDGGTNTCYYYWPSNNLWSQSYETNSGCNNMGSVESQPSNWDPSPGLGVYPGGPGAIGVNVVLGPPANTLLDARVTLNSLTLQTNGGLSLGGKSHKPHHRQLG
jgi:hypothetical protein